MAWFFSALTAVWGNMKLWNLGLFDHELWNQTKKNRKFQTTMLFLPAREIALTCHTVSLWIWARTIYYPSPAPGKNSISREMGSGKTSDTISVLLGLARDGTTSLRPPMSLTIQLFFLACASEGNNWESLGWFLHNSSLSFIPSFKKCSFSTRKS